MFVASCLLCIIILQSPFSVETTLTKNCSLNQHLHNLAFFYLIATSLTNFKSIQKAKKGTHEDAHVFTWVKKKIRKRDQHKYTSLDSFMFKE